MYCILMQIFMNLYGIRIKQVHQVYYDSFQVCFQVCEIRKWRSFVFIVLQNAESKMIGIQNKPGLYCSSETFE